MINRGGAYADKSTRKSEESAILPNLMERCVNMLLMHHSRARSESVKTNRDGKPAFALLALFTAFFIAALFAAWSGPARGDEGEGFKIKVASSEGGSPIYIPVKVEGSRVRGTYAGPATDPLGRPLSVRLSFSGTIDSEHITGKLVSHAEETVNGHTTIYDGELDGVVMAIEGAYASSDWCAFTNRYRDAETGMGGSYSFSLQFSADLTPLLDSGYEFPAPETAAGEESDAISGETGVSGSDGGERDGGSKHSAASGAVACLLAAAAAVTALVSASWKTAARAALAIGGLFSRRHPPGLEIPPPPPLPPPPPAVTPEKMSPPETASAGQEALVEGTDGKAREAPAGPEARTEPSNEKRYAPPPREETAASHLKAWEHEGRRYMSMFESGQLTYDDFTMLRAWRLYDRVPMEEIEIRARLMLLKNREYMDFYNYVAGKITDNVIEGQLWEQASRLHPVATTVSQLKDLASMPYELITGFYEYQDASAAEAVLNEYVNSYVLKTPEAVQKALEETNRSLVKKVQESQALSKRLERGYRWEKGEARPQTPLELEEAARWNPHRIKADIDALDKEARALEYRRKALDLRMKTIKGDWKQVVTRWESR